MTLKNLRWATVWLPVLLIIAVVLAEDLLLEPLFGRWFGHAITFLVVSIGALTLSYFVFKTVDQTEQYLLRQNRDLAALNEISRVISGSLHLDAIIERALEKVIEVVETEASEVFLLDIAEGELVFKMHTGLAAEAFQEITTFPVGEGFPGLVAATGEPLVVSDLASDPRFKRQAVVAQGFRSVACVPLRAKDRVVGVMSIADRHKIYTNDELNLLTSIGNQIGLAIENASLFAQVEETLGYLNAVIKSSGDAIITTDMKGNIRSWNPAAEHIYGWPAEEALGKYLPMVPAHLLEEAGGIIDKLHAGETIFNMETQRLRKSGDLISVVVTASPVRDASSDEIIGLAGISKDISEKKQLEAEINRQRQSLAVLEERERIAREMHDGLAQVLGYVNTKAQAVRRFLATGNTDEAQTHLLQLEEAALEVYDDVREAILGLRTPVSSEKGLKDTLQGYFNDFERQSGIRVELIIPNGNTLEKFAPPVEVQLIRIIQESLTNIRKHADANSASVYFEQIDDQAQITIEDNGRGFNQTEFPRGQRPRFGFQTMRERAEGVGGTLDIQSSPGSGTRIRVTLPLERTEE